jgi:hypothetical protein
MTIRRQDMLKTDYVKLVEKLMEQEKALLQTKGEEYTNANPDRLSSFKEIGAALGISPTVVCLVFMYKHWNAVLSYARTGHVKSNESIHGRIMDLRVYFGLLDGLVTEAEQGALEAKPEPGFATKDFMETAFVEGSPAYLAIQDLARHVDEILLKGKAASKEKDGGVDLEAGERMHRAKDLADARDAKRLDETRDENRARFNQLKAEAEEKERLEKERALDAQLELQAQVDAIVAKGRQELKEPPKPPKLEPAFKKKQDEGKEAR